MKWDVLVVLLLVVMIGGAFFEFVTHEPGKAERPTAGQQEAVQDVRVAGHEFGKAERPAGDCSIPWAGWEARHQRLLADYDLCQDAYCKGDVERAMLLFEAEFQRALEDCPQVRAGR